MCAKNPRRPGRPYATGKSCWMLSTTGTFLRTLNSEVTGVFHEWQRCEAKPIRREWLWNIRWTGRNNLASGPQARHAAWMQLNQRIRGKC
eukprot:1832109-Amphidinium_carterae.2